MLDVKQKKWNSSFDFRMEIPYIWRSVIPKIETNGIPNTYRESYSSYLFYN